MLDDLPRLAWFALAALFVVGLVAAQKKINRVSSAVAR